MSYHEREVGKEEELSPIRVAVCSTPWLSVPPESYGGIEALVYDSLLAYPDQKIDYFLYTVGETAQRETASHLSPQIGWVYDKGLYPRIREASALTKEAIHTINFYKDLERRISAGEHFDLVHHHMMFTGTVFALGKRIKLPHLVTVHGPLEDEFDLEFLKSTIGEEGIYFTSISDNQGRHLPELNWVKTVHNGIDVENFPLKTDKKDFMLSVGRIHPDKGQMEAIEVARQLGKSLVLAGNIDDQQYFDWKIVPNIDVRADLMGSAFTAMELTQAVLERAKVPEVIYFGEANFTDKVWLYQNARVFINPLNWEEPFGLVMVEAMACGTPVVSIARGAAPEIVEHGRTGFLVADVGEMVERVSEIYQYPNLIRAVDCRKRVEEHFSNRSMASEYREAYDEVLRREQLKV